jgi:hypothetical protein
LIECHFSRTGKPPQSSLDQGAAKKSEMNPTKESQFVVMSDLFNDTEFYFL